MVPILRTIFPQVHNGNEHPVQLSTPLALAVCPQDLFLANNDQSSLALPQGLILVFWTTNPLWLCIHDYGLAPKFWETRDTDHFFYDCLLDKLCSGQLFIFSLTFYLVCCSTMFLSNCNTDCVISTYDLGHLCSIYR